MWEQVDAGLREAFKRHPDVRTALPALLAQVISGGLQDMADELSAQMRSMMKDLTR